MLVVNLFGAPGAGKSTGAAYVFSQLKMRGINAELVTEFAKDKVWEENDEVFKNQEYIFGKQSFRLSRINEKVDVAVTDSPLLLSAFYNNDVMLDEDFNNVVYYVFVSYDNINFFVNRCKPYNETGRVHSEIVSNEITSQLKNMLDCEYIAYKEVEGNIQGYERIVNDICDRLNVKTETPICDDKPQLKTGMFGKTNTGGLFVVVGDYIIYQNGEYDRVSTFPFNVDIRTFGTSKHQCITNLYDGIYSFDRLDVLVRGEVVPINSEIDILAELNPIKTMTQAEIEKELGCKIKIVEEN